MNFNEAFEKYRANTASEEEIRFVEAEIEKNRLIGDYLEEKSSFSLPQTLPPVQADGDWKRIRRAVKRRSIVLVTSSVAILLALLLAFQFVGKPLLNKLYYDPTTHRYNEFIGDFELYLMVYTNLHFPGLYQMNSSSKNTGIGKYSLSLPRYDVLSGSEKILSGSITRGNLSLPEEFWRGYPYANSFSYGDSYVSSPSKEDLSNMLGYLKTLPDYLRAEVYLSFDRDLTALELAGLLQKYPDTAFVWLAIRSVEQGRQLHPTIGFEPTGLMVHLDDINESYPDFQIFGALDNITDTSALAALYESHFQAMLKFQLDHPDIAQVREWESEANALEQHRLYYQGVSQYIRENGLNSYGVVMVGSCAEIVKLAEENPFICEIQLRKLALDTSPPEDPAA